VLLDISSTNYVLMVRIRTVTPAMTVPLLTLTFLLLQPAAARRRMEFNDAEHLSTRGMGRVQQEFVPAVMPHVLGGAVVGRPCAGSWTTPAAARAAFVRGIDRASSSVESMETIAPSLVYIARVPLVGLEALEWGLGDRYPGGLEHTMVLVRHLECDADRCEDRGAVTAYDFVPENPTSPLTAAALLSGTSVPGKLRTRTLRGLPSRRCDLVGEAVVGARLGGGTASQREVDARCAEFQVSYNPQLSLRGNSCREHTAALASMLTGRDIRGDELVPSK